LLIQLAHPSSLSPYTTLFLSLDLRVRVGALVAVLSIDEPRLVGAHRLGDELMRLTGFLDPVAAGRGLRDPPRRLRAVGHEVAVAEVRIIEVRGGLGEVLELASV